MWDLGLLPEGGVAVWVFARSRCKGYNACAMLLASRDAGTPMPESHDACMRTSYLTCNRHAKNCSIRPHESRRVSEHELRK